MQICLTIHPGSFEKCRYWPNKLRLSPRFYFFHKFLVNADVADQRTMLLSRKTEWRNDRWGLKGTLPFRDPQTTWESKLQEVVRRDVCMWLHVYVYEYIRFIQTYKLFKNGIIQTPSGRGEVGWIGSLGLTYIYYYA